MEIIEKEQNGVSIFKLTGRLDSKTSPDFEAKIFDAYESKGNTFLLTYGEGKLKLRGIHDIEIDATYRITYKSRQRNFADIIISIEKIS